jgi:hypothetical protein
MMVKRIIPLILIFLIFSSCYKEQKLADQLDGTWNIIELQWANNSIIDIGDDKHSIEFFPCEKAYTATCGGVYTLDYEDTSLVDLRDTFEFDIKEEELAVTNVKLTNNQNQYVIRFLRQRFQIEQLDENTLQLDRIRTFADSTAGFLKATKQ